MVKGHSHGRESWKSWTLDMLMWEQCRIKPVYEQLHMPAADDADLLMRCFGCATGGDQVFYSALSATDLSHLARSASVTLQLEMWSPSSIAHDRKWKERVNRRLKNEKPKACRAFWWRETLCCLFLGRLFLSCLQIRAMLSSKLLKIKWRFPWCSASVLFREP